MTNSDLQSKALYNAPICKFVELDTNATICNGSEVYCIEDWTTNDSSVEF